MSQGMEIRRGGGIHSLAKGHDPKQRSEFFRLKVVKYNGSSEHGAWHHKFGGTSDLFIVIGVLGSRHFKILSDFVEFAAGNNTSLVVFLFEIEFSEVDRRE